MSKDKVWKFKYEDDIVRCWDQVAGHHFKTAKHRVPGLGFLTKDEKHIGCAIEYDVTIRKCYIYSDVELANLTLVGTDEAKQNNRGTKEEFDAIPVTIQGVEI